MIFSPPAWARIFRRKPARMTPCTPRGRLSLGAMTHFSPREIVSELDRHIVGQQDAKRRGHRLAQTAGAQAG